MLDKTKIKIADTGLLRKVNTASMRLGYNRTLDAKAVKSLQPQGLHLVSSLLLHEHAGGQAVDPHMRCHVWLAVKGKAYPIETMLDVTLKDYERLPTVADYEAAVEGSW